MTSPESALRLERLAARLAVLVARAARRRDPDAAGLAEVLGTLREVAADLDPSARRCRVCGGPIVDDGRRPGPRRVRCTICRPPRRNPPQSAGSGTVAA